MYRTLTAEDAQKLDEVLADLLVQVEADAVMLCDRGGNVLAQRAVKEFSQEDSVAALAAGSFFATAEMARLLGQQEFRQVLHQGDGLNIFMQRTATDMLLLVLFGAGSNPGLVKIHALAASEKLKEYDLLVDQLHPEADTTFEVSTETHAFQPISRNS